VFFARLLDRHLIGDGAGANYVAFNDHFASAQEIGVDHVRGYDGDDNAIIADDAAFRRFSERKRVDEGP
jgi:hypothetical protein